MAVSDDRMTTISRFGDVANRTTLTPQQAARVQRFTRVPPRETPADAFYIRTNEILRETVLEQESELEPLRRLAAVIRTWATGQWEGHDLTSAIVAVAQYNPEATANIRIPYGILRAILVNAKQ